jgi:hypothetical protein
MGVSCNPVAYMPENESNVIGDGDNSVDTTVSTLCVLTRAVTAVVNL